MSFSGAHPPNPKGQAQPGDPEEAGNGAEWSPIVPPVANRPGLGANDGPADDFIATVEGWPDEAGSLLRADDRSDQAEQQRALDQIAGSFSAGQMRSLGASLLKLADALDDAWHPAGVRSEYHWMTRAGHIERRSLQLAQVAGRLRAAARRRRRHLSGEWFGEPAWEMLLELFIQFSGGARVSTKSLVIASGAADTTALRIMDRLEEAELIQRSPSQTDKRVTLVGLTRRGVVAVGSVLMEAEA
jgi:hypothetical protein